MEHGGTVCGGIRHPQVPGGVPGVISNITALLEVKVVCFCLFSLIQWSKYGDSLSRHPRNIWDTISGHESAVEDRVNSGLNKNVMKSNALWNLGYICLSNVQINASI